MAHAAVDPNIERVVATDRSCGSTGQSAPLRIIEGEPGIRSLLGHHLGDLGNDGGVKDQFPFRGVKDRERHTPGALAGDAPVGTGLDRSTDAVSTPMRDPVGGIDFLERCLTQGIDADEELLHGTEKNRGL